MDDNDLEVLECSETPGLSEQTSNSAIDLVDLLQNLLLLSWNLNYIFVLYRIGNEPSECARES